MRRIVFLALIVLLALRGLTAPAMAAQMAAGGLHGTVPSAQAAAALHAGHAPGAAPDSHGADAQAALPSCHPAAAGHPGDPGCDPQSPHASHAACADCEVCHTAVMAPPAARLAAGPHRGTLKPRAAIRFASALPAQATKPPIA
ncbi:hypothetical protein M4R22_16600 [Acidovorax sp. GBBC 3334]|uniref:hypothetical protein n=1 Tax=Acidovorax sp. GBBC 3334 TaxID=2940496 RepID=UPI0023021C8A|nr:hypothetical protein [Acidovorax sp. GBBC 3334]MDA8456385.1 hypothetical protein [Acidovorax sp. GBBC 3334]